MRVFWPALSPARVSGRLLGLRVGGGFPIDGTNAPGLRAACDNVGHFVGWMRRRQQGHTEIVLRLRGVSQHVTEPGEGERPRIGCGPALTRTDVTRLLRSRASLIHQGKRASRDGRLPILGPRRGRPAGVVPKGRPKKRHPCSAIPPARLVDLAWTPSIVKCGWCRRWDAHSNSGNRQHRCAFSLRFPPCRRRAHRPRPVPAWPSA